MSDIGEQLQKAQAGDIEAISEVMEYYWHVDRQTDQYSYWLAEWRKAEKKRLKKKAELHYAVESGDTEKVKELLKNGADVNLGVPDTATSFCKSGVDGFTPLMMAVVCDNVGMIKLLIENGADVGQEDDHDTDILTYAIHNECIDAFLYLVNEVKIDFNNEWHIWRIREWLQEVQDRPWKNAKYRANYFGISEKDYPAFVKSKQYDKFREYDQKDIALAERLKAFMKERHIAEKAEKNELK